MHNMDYVKQEDLKNSRRKNSRSDGSLKSSKSTHTEEHKISKHWTDVDEANESDYKDQRTQLFTHN
jgi:hypothetical protein